jgi:hypothetical protein
MNTDENGSHRCGEQLPSREHMAHLLVNSTPVGSDRIEGSLGCTRDNPFTSVVIRGCCSYRGSG